MSVSNPPEKRNYRREYDNYHGKPEQIKKRAQRNAAHSAVEKASGKNISSDVHHKQSLRKGGSNNSDNLAVASVSKNRSWRKGKTGYD
jgi:hypothetical protein